MSDCVAKCGIDCGVCPWGPYPRQGLNAQDFEQFRNRAKQILGYMPIITACATCQTPDAKIPKQAKLPNRRCLIRRCVDLSGVANCAYCSRFPCDTVKATAGAWNRESVEAKLGASLSEQDYQVFVQPFEGLKRLQTIRASLKPQEIVEPAKAPSLKTKIVDFPKNLPFPQKEAASFEAVHKLIAAIANSPLGLRDTDTFAQQHKLENIRAHVLRFLWILGRFGTFEDDNGGHLVVDSLTFEANRGTEKTLAIWAFVKDTVFQALSDLGICGERVALKGVKEEDLTTGTGYLRSRGWVMRMSFEEKVGGAAALKALLAYTQKVDEKFGKKAFQRFREADMQVLLKT